MSKITSLLFVLLFWPAIAMQAQYGSSGAGKTNLPPHTQATCPWLSPGSAATALGGDVSVTVNVTNLSEGSCRFSRQQGSHDSLEIAVSMASLPTCSGEHTTLRGIGNEAARCRFAGAHGEAVEMVSSRVRDEHFTVTLTWRGPKAAAHSPDEQDDALEQAAEQVAGNLY
jgi:hypothetical protein